MGGCGDFGDRGGGGSGPAAPVPLSGRGTELARHSRTVSGPSADPHVGSAPPKPPREPKLLPEPPARGGGLERGLHGISANASIRPSARSFAAAADTVSRKPTTSSLVFMHQEGASQ
jgi:hypothetical protein